MEWKYKVHLYRSQRERVLISLLFFVVGVCWDSFAVFQRHWIFPGDGLIGIKIGLLPIEEFLFFLIMPFWTLTVYKILDRKIK